MSARAIASVRKQFATKVAARLERAGESPHVEGVLPLNPGFFKIQRLRAHGSVKRRAK